MEHLDVLDPSGNPTGISKPKTEIHKDGDWHRDAHIWIVNSKGELLVQKRASIKDNYPDYWDVSGAGHISAGEKSIDAAVREIKEELGLEVSPDELEFLFTTKTQDILNNGTYFDNEFNDVYLLRKDIDISSITLQLEEVAEIKLIPFKELEKLITKGGDVFIPRAEYKELFKELHKRFS